MDLNSWGIFPFKLSGPARSTSCFGIVLDGAPWKMQRAFYATERGTKRHTLLKEINGDFTIQDGSLERTWRFLYLQCPAAFRLLLPLPNSNLGPHPSLLPRPSQHWEVFEGQATVHMSLSRGQALPLVYLGNSSIRPWTAFPHKIP